MRGLLLTSLLRLLAAMPDAVICALGAGLGRLFYRLPNRRVRSARINLKLCLPGLSAAEREHLLRNNFIELGKSILEAGILWTTDKTQILARIRETRGEEELKRLMALGKGVILAVPHLGAWEMMGLYGSIHFPFNALYRAREESAAGLIVHRARERFGAKLYPSDNSGIRALYKALAGGEMVGMLPDQVPGGQSGSVFAPFFGIPASTMVLLSRLAMKSGAPVLFAFAERLPRSLDYRLHFLAAPKAINQGSVESSAAVVNMMVEQCVRLCPEQYQWIYKRFRVRPPGTQKYY